VHNLGAAQMIVCRIAITLEYALEVAQEPFGTFPQALLGFQSLKQSNKKAEDSHRQQERRHRFQDEQPLPAMHAEDPVEPHQRGGYRRADHG
jgi:hypothetical protein